MRALGLHEISQILARKNRSGKGNFILGFMKKATIV